MALPARIPGRQRALTAVFFQLGRLFAWAGPRVDWIVGPEEIASMVSQIGTAVPRSFTMVRYRHRFYDARFGLVIERAGARFEAWRRFYLGAVALGWLLGRARGVVYVGPNGFLDGTDDRAWEFGFIKAKRRAIVCYWTGGDIRSPALMKAQAETSGVANVGSILFDSGEPFDQPAYEAIRRKRAELADQFADVVFTARVDQLAYLARPTEPFLYFYPDEQFTPDAAKFRDLSKIVVLHAPSHPTIKGTATVRAVMERISSRYAHVEYRELQDVPNRDILAALDGAHIVVNQLHAQMPGVFGVEAMARNCVMVCSADPAVETDLVDAEGAWVIADPDTLEQRLVELVEHPESLAPQARRGYEWALAHASASAAGATLRGILERASRLSRKR